jgi:hypothetical protein
MMLSRLGIVPDKRLLALAPHLSQWLETTGDGITPKTFEYLVDGLMERLLRSMCLMCNASATAIWIVSQEEKALIPVWNSSQAEFVNTYRQPLDRGIVSMVFSTEMPFLETSPQTNIAFDPTLDTQLNNRTNAIMAAPFYFLRACRGVISSVQLAGGNEPPREREFAAHDLEHLDMVTTIVGGIIDRRILETYIGFGEG